jgi:hypothetical protein
MVFAHHLEIPLPLEFQLFQLRDLLLQLRVFELFLDGQVGLTGQGHLPAQFLQLAADQRKQLLVLVLEGCVWLVLFSDALSEF